MIGSGIFVFIQFLLFLFIGSLIYIYFNGAALEKDREFAFFIVNELPIGLKGLLLAGVLGAAMSTLSSSINSLASSFMTDWWKRPSTIRMSQAVSFAFAVIVTFVALFFDESDQAIVMVGLEIASFTYGGLLGLFLLARGKKNYHTVSLTVGFAGSLAMVSALKYFGVPLTWFVAAGTAINLLLAVTIEKFYKKV